MPKLTEVFIIKEAGDGDYESEMKLTEPEKEIILDAIQTVEEAYEEAATPAYGQLNLARHEDLLKLKDKLVRGPHVFTQREIRAFKEALNIAEERQQIKVGTSVQQFKQLRGKMIANLSPGIFARGDKKPV